MCPKILTWNTSLSLTFSRNPTSLIKCPLLGVPYKRYCVYPCCVGITVVQVQAPLFIKQHDMCKYPKITVSHQLYCIDY